jgi:hypothetical protein
VRKIEKAMPAADPIAPEEPSGSGPGVAGGIRSMEADGAAICRPLPAAPEVRVAIVNSVPIPIWMSQATETRDREPVGAPRFSTSFSIVGPAGARHTPGWKHEPAGLPACAFERGAEGVAPVLDAGGATANAGATVD